MPARCQAFRLDDLRACGPAAVKTEASAASGGLSGLPAHWRGPSPVTAARNRDIHSIDYSLTTERCLRPWDFRRRGKCRAIENT